MQNASIARAITVAGETKSQMARITANAQKEKARRDARKRVIQKAQTAREQQLDKCIAVAMRGVSALVTMGKDEQIQKLVKARAEIGKSFPLYTAYRDGGSAWIALVDGERDDGGYVWGCRIPRDQEINTEVRFEQNVIIVAIYILFCSYFPSDSSHAKDEEVLKWECKIPLPFTRRERKVAATQLRMITIVSTSSPLEEWDLSSDESSPVTDELLKEIERTDAHLATDDTQTKHEWEANLVLLRFLMDCSRPRQLQNYLKVALERI